MFAVYNKAPWLMLSNTLSQGFFVPVGSTRLLRGAWWVINHYS